MRDRDPSHDAKHSTRRTEHPGKRAGMTSRRVMVVAAVVSSVLFAVAGIIVHGEDSRPANFGDLHHQASGGDFIFLTTVHASPGHRVFGHVIAHPGPDRIQFVPGSEVDRILAGEAPRTVYATFAPSGFADVSMAQQPFQCTGTTGSCMPGDLPVLVVSKGTSWKGIQQAQMSRDADPTLARVSLEQDAAYVGPTVTWLAMGGLACALVCLGSLVAWLSRGGLRPAPGLDSPPTMANAEQGLWVMQLAESYAASILRSRSFTGIAILVGGILGQLVLVPYVVDERLEAHFPLANRALEPLVDMSFWLWIPIVTLVGVGLWLRHWLDSRVALRHLQAVRAQLADARATLLEA